MSPTPSPKKALHLQHYAGARECRVNDAFILRLFRKSLVEEITASAPGFERRLHGRGSDGEVVEALRCLVDFQLARHGDPNHAGIARWEPYSMARRQTLLFDLPTALADDPRGAERRFWRQAPFIQRGTM